MEEITENEEICPADRGHLVKLVNMSMQQLWDMAYKAGYEDGMCFMTEKETNVYKEEIR